MTRAPEPAPGPYAPALRLLAIPFLVCIAWLIETWLLAGNTRLLGDPEPAGIVLYTGAGCIFTGMVIPLILLRKAFVTGSVNMFQIGFRTVQRTLLAAAVTTAIGLVLIALFNPLPDRPAFAGAFLLILPTAIASVMVCWVLAGTHVQAFVRAGGAPLSIATGVVITGLLFAASTVALDPAVRHEGALFWPVCTGMGAALFFFAVRDVYATTIVVAGCGVFLHAAAFPPALLQDIPVAAGGMALLTTGVLLAIHLFLFRNYRTILVPERGESPEGKP
jgi:hypothetical protein